METPQTNQSQEEEKEKKAAPLGLKIQNPKPSTFLEKLKAANKKDLAFIGSGLALLTILPVLQHQMFKPDEQVGELSPGFSTWQGPATDGGAGTELYEPGTGGFAPGTTPSQTGDYILPLEARDPTQLVTGLGGGSQEKGPDLKDALTRALQVSAGQADRSAGLPKPSEPFVSLVRGFGAFGGGGGGTSASAPLSPGGILQSAQEVPGRVGSRPQAYSGALPITGYKGVGSRTGESTRGALEDLKAQADKAANFSRTGSAVTALEDAAKASPIGAAGQRDGAGGFGAGEAGKRGEGHGFGGSKSLGESLDFMRRKIELEKELERKWKAKGFYGGEVGGFFGSDLGMEMVKTMANKGFAEPIGGGIGNLIGGKTWTGDDREQTVIFYGKKNKHGQCPPDSDDPQRDEILGNCIAGKCSVEPKVKGTAVYKMKGKGDSKEPGILLGCFLAKQDLGQGLGKTMLGAVTAPYHGMKWLAGKVKGKSDGSDAKVSPGPLNPLASGKGGGSKRTSRSNNKARLQELVDGHKKVLAQLRETEATLMKQRDKLNSQIRAIEKSYTPNMFTNYKSLKEDLLRTLYDLFEVRKYIKEQQVLLEGAEAQLSSTP